MEKPGLGQVKNLIMLALADGKATESELAVIAGAAAREQLTQEELDKLIENPDSVRITLPEDDETRQRYLKDMVQLMMIDGVIDDTEMAMCKIYAINLGFESTAVEQIVLELTSKLE
ncbi:MAG: hypothetical protein IJT30_11055 [Muribaculaceae bacterium]|nr:hypothetical protein [Muribaculaceae bacterium]